MIDRREYDAVTIDHQLTFTRLYLISQSTLYRVALNAAIHLSGGN